MAKTFFVTGTDTDAGKTFFSVALLNAMKAQGYTTTAMKPVAAGCEQGKNDDAIKLQTAITAKPAYSRINPIALEEAIAPHIAAQQQQQSITAKQLHGFARDVMASQEDYCLIEGAGGWLCPLNNQETLADFVQLLHVPVILVVGMKLGCLNHTMLTVQAIQQAGLPLAGWVANTVDPSMPVHQENVAYLEQAIAAPCIAKLPWCESADTAARAIDLRFLNSITA